MKELLTALITAATALVVAFGAQAVARRYKRKDEAQEEFASGSAAKLGAEAHLLGLLLDRIDKLEKRLDANAQRSLERQTRIEGLEADRDGCKQELEELRITHRREMDDLTASHTALKAQFEKQLDYLAAHPSGTQKEK